MLSSSLDKLARVEIQVFHVQYLCKRRTVIGRTQTEVTGWRPLKTRQRPSEKRWHSSKVCVFIMSQPRSFSSQSYSPQSTSTAKSQNPNENKINSTEKSKEKDHMVGLNDKFVELIDKVSNSLYLVEWLIYVLTTQPWQYSKCCHDIDNNSLRYCIGYSYI